MSYILKTNLAARGNYGSIRSLSKIKYIVLHYTANDGDTDESNANFFKTSGRGSSAHYFVDDNSVTRTVPDNYVAWSVGGNRYSNYKTTGGASLYKTCTNTNSINIEMCDTKRNGKYDVSEKTLLNTIELVILLMKKYKISISSVIRHFDVTGKSCPAYFIDNGIWNNMKKRISDSYNNSSIVNNMNFISNSIDYSPVFEPLFYSNKYLDLKAAFGTNGTMLFNHFITHGMIEGRQGSEKFNVNIYKENYPDLKKAFGNNLPSYYMHYCTNGRIENRKAV